MILLYRDFLIYRVLFLRSLCLFCFGLGLRFLLAPAHSDFRLKYLAHDL